MTILLLASHPIYTLAFSEGIFCKKFPVLLILIFADISKNFRVLIPSQEANSINLSLSALGDVISALTSEQSYVPYRNASLTLLLQDCLGGNSKTIMFLTVTPAEQSFTETLYSLR